MRIFSRTPVESVKWTINNLEVPVTTTAQEKEDEQKTEEIEEEANVEVHYRS